MFVPGQNQLLANLSLLLFLRIFRSFVFMILKRTFEECVSLFSYQRSFSHCRLFQTALLLYHVVFCLSRSFFNFFEVVFFSLAATLISYHIQPAVVKNFFHLFFTTFCQTQLVYIITSLFRCQELFSSLFHPTQKEGFEPSHGANRLYP